MIEILQQRLDRYRVGNALEQEHALKEILQEVGLYALWRADFFDVAAFQGGTSLRILQRLPRFSEGLDFILKTPDAGFDWQRYLEPMTAVLTEFGLRSELLDKSRMDSAVRTAVLKGDSISQQLNLEFVHGPTDKKLRIKLEIDVNPPAGSGFAYTYLDFPLDHEVCHQDLASNFALKIHALLCRPYLKGRDWFDFGWYVAQDVQPNLPLLQAALLQQGPWRDQPLVVDVAWLQATLRHKLASIDWRAAAEDVRRFLAPAQQHSLRLWSAGLFSAKVGKLG